MDHAPTGKPVFHSSVAAEAAGADPPIANPAHVVPAEPPTPLAVVKSPTSTQLVPFHSSVITVRVGGGFPPPLDLLLFSQNLRQKNRLFLLIHIFLL